MKTMPSKVVKTRSTSYQFTDPGRLLLDFNNSQNINIKNKINRALLMNFEEGSKLEKEREERYSQVMAKAEGEVLDIDNSNLNTILSTLI